MELFSIKFSQLYQKIPLILSIPITNLNVSDKELPVGQSQSQGGQGGQGDLESVGARTTSPSQGESIIS